MLNVDWMAVGTSAKFEVLSRFMLAHIHVT